MVEYLIIAVLVLWSSLVVFKKVFPKTQSKLAHALADICQTRGWQGCAKWLRPKAATGCSGGCGCSSDDSNVKKSTETQTVKWR